MCGLLSSAWRFGATGCLLAGFVALAVPGALAGLPSTNSAAAGRESWRPDSPFTVEQALGRALTCDRRITSLKAAVEVARENRLAATDIKDPVLRAESRSLGQNESASSEDFEEESRISVGAYLPNPWTTVPRVSARTADYQAARADLAAANWLVGCEVRQVFAQIEYLTNDLALSADQVRLNSEVLKAVQDRTGQGAATVSELMTASRQFVEFQDELDQTCHRLQLARQQLASLLDVPVEDLEIATNGTALLSPPPSLTVQQAEAVTLRSRWDLAALRWRTQAAESAYRETRNAAVPWIKDVEAGYLNSSDKAWVGLSMDIPIFTWTKNHAADAARARASLAGVEETNGLKLVRQELHDALDEVDQTRRQAERNQATVEPLITAMRQNLATLKNTPNTLPDQVAAAELQLVETVRHDLAVRWQYQLALRNLERSTGAPIDQITAGAPAPDLPAAAR